MDLRDKRILVVEDDYYLAHDICDDLKRHHATVLGPAPTPFFASNLLSHRRIDGAVLDVILHREHVYDLADELCRRGVPLLFATALGSDQLPERFRDFPHIQKPYSAIEVVSAMQHLVYPAQAAKPEPLFTAATGQPAKRMTRLLIEAIRRNASRHYRGRDRLH